MVTGQNTNIQIQLYLFIMAPEMDIFKIPFRENKNIAQWKQLCKGLSLSSPSKIINNNNNNSGYRSI